MKFRLISVVSLLILAPAIAQAETIECSLDTNQASGGWVTESYAFQYDPSSGKALVADAVILEFNEGPIPADVSTDTSEKLVLIWDVGMTNSDGQITNMHYRAAYFRTNGSITVRAQPGGYANSFEARGSCKSL